MAASPPPGNFGWQAREFELPATDGRSYRLEDIRGEHGFLLMFICNHCPYVLAVIDRIVRDARDLQELGIGVAAICSNDAEQYLEDSFPKMLEMAQERNFCFPYLHDETQAVARAYDAVCTPDFFGFARDGSLQYRGRLDASRKESGPPDLRRDLFEAMKQIAATGKGPAEQIASIGCSIKWKSH